MAEYEECFCCEKRVRTDKKHWRVHMTEDLRIVPEDYDGVDSQGTFAVGPSCRKRHAHAFRADAW